MVADEKDIRVQGVPVRVRSGLDPVNHQGGFVNGLLLTNAAVLPLGEGGLTSGLGAQGAGSLVTKVRGHRGLSCEEGLGVGVIGWQEAGLYLGVNL